MKRRRNNLSRKRTTARLVRMALRAWDSDAGWAAIHELRRRASEQTLALVRQLADHPGWRRRALGLNIAAQLHRRDKSATVGSTEYAPQEARRLLLAGLRDPHDEVLIAASAGLGHRVHAAALEDLVRLAVHANRAVRFGVTFALSSYPQPEALNALLRLARDADDEVRDWATFGLGSLHDADTPEIRELLLRNLGDTDANVRGEAVVGLAARGDARAIDHLLALGDEDWRCLDLNAAEKLASPRLLPALQALQQGAQGQADINASWLGDLCLALEACGGPVAAG